MENEISKYNIEFYDLNSKRTIRHDLTVQEGRHPENRNVTWNCDFQFEGLNLNVRNEYFLSGVLRQIREVIEPKGFRALVVCSEKNASHSRMQADMTNGTKIYKLETDNNAKGRKQYHVFDKSSIDLVVPIQVQDEFAKNFYSEFRKTNSKRLPWYKRLFN